VGSGERRTGLALTIISSVGTIVGKRSLNKPTVDEVVSMFTRFKCAGRDLRDERRKQRIVVRESFAVLLLSTTIGTPALAYCAIDEAMRQVETYNDRLHGEIANETSRLLREQEVLNWRAKHSSVAVNQKLSQQDFVRALQLNIEMMILRSKDLVNSSYLRDLRAMVKAANVALKMRDGTTIVHSHPDAFYQKVAKVALSIDPRSNVTISRDDCSVDSALFTLERSGMDQVDFQASGADTERAIEYVHTIENLRTLNRIAIMKFQDNMDEVRQSEQHGSFSEQFGKTWKDRLKASSSKMKSYNQILSIISDVIPSDFAIENQRVPDAAKMPPSQAAVTTKDRQLRRDQ
jgi:hypothetical protein